MQAEEFIKNVYKNYPKPIYLSRLGAMLKENHLVVRNLKEYIENMEGFTVACGPEKERTAIASLEDKDDIEKMLTESANKVDGEALNFLSKLPKTFLYAFSSKSKGNPNVYISNHPPYKFSFSKDNDSMIEINNDLLIDAMVPVNIKNLDASLIDKLYNNIQNWIKDNNFEFSNRETAHNNYCENKGVTLLEEIINSIPANKRSKVIFPLDIIEHLIKRK